MRRYFQESHPTLQQRLDEHTDAAATAFEKDSGSKAEALILGGGYGRGEGGVYTDAAGARHLYNDLDYFLFTHQADNPDLRARISSFEREWSDKLGIDVEIQALPPKVLKNVSTNMMLHDLVAGHHVIAGAPEYLSPYLPAVNAQSIAPSEATRLLWNRGSGLYFAHCRLSQEPSEENRTFIHRNHQKCRIAFGDALLCLLGQHHVLAGERHQRLLKLTGHALLDEALLEHHREGLRFKLNPYPPPEDFDLLREENARLTADWARYFLAFESHRLTHEFSSLTAYAGSGMRLLSDYSTPHALLISIRDQMRHGQALRPRAEYPRAALFRALACLLSDESPQFAANYLGGSKSAISLDYESRYKNWWRRYS
jgi:hypothetical protein